VLWRSSILRCRIRFNEERISKSWGGQTRQASPIITRVTLRRFMVFVPLGLRNARVESCKNEMICDQRIQGHTVNLHCLLASVKLQR
jgi:hypothetical protein